MTAWEEYHRALLEAHRNVGAPSTRAIAGASPEVMSHSTVNDILGGRRLPKLSILHNILTGMGVGPGVAAHLKLLWQDAYEEVTGRQVAEAVPATAQAPTNAQILIELRRIRELMEELVLLQQTARSDRCT